MKKSADEIIKELFVEHNQDREILTDYKTIKLAMETFSNQKEKVIKCPECHGTGNALPGASQNEYLPCLKCQGRGEIYACNH